MRLYYKDNLPLGQFSLYRIIIHRQVTFVTDNQDECHHMYLFKKEKGTKEDERGKKTMK
jgi:hypothetical protein